MRNGKAQVQFNDDFNLGFPLHLTESIGGNCVREGEGT
jgi:hypothetical protein